MDTLKRACERCTRSKVKCDFGREQEPCKRCLAKGYICVYRPKRKRGPQKDKAKKTENKENSSAQGDFYCRVSSLERRIWSVFFTIFKHQNLFGSTYAWCWFAQQLEKLDKHLEKTKNETSRQMLVTWMEALNLDVAAIKNKFSNTCAFKPSLCSGCSTEAIAAPVVPQTLYQEPGYELEWVEDDGKPFLTSFNADAGATVVVNSAFTETFGLTSGDMQRLLEWSGGGFLPWGGDLLAKLVVKETDLHVFLQILALKFKSLGARGKGHEHEVRQIPSTHVFELWCVDDDGELTSYQPYHLKCLHKETLRNNEMTAEMRIKFRPVGPRVRANFGDHPVTLDQPIEGDTDSSGRNHQKNMVKKLRTEEQIDLVTLSELLEDDEEEEEDDDVRIKEESHVEIAYEDSDPGPNLKPIDSNRQFVTDKIPDELAEYYDWSDDVAYVTGKDPVSGKPIIPGPPTLDGNTDLAWLENLMPEESTFLTPSQ